MSRTGIVTCLALGVVTMAGRAFTEPLAEVRNFGSSVEFSPKTWGHGFLLRVVAPDGSVVDKTVKEGVPGFDLSELKGPIVDGQYKYELRLIVSPPRGRRNDAEIAKAAAMAPSVNVPSLVGVFLVNGGSVVAVSPATPAGLATPGSAPDLPAAEIQEPLCVGWGCVHPESFGYYDTLKLKDAWPGIHFADTDGRHWRITANDAVSEHLAFSDVTSDTAPLRIEAGAPSNALYVEGSGNVGIGSIPILDLHIVSGDQPGLRLEQDTSLGSPAQVWDLEGHEGSFWIQDATHDTYPLQIQQNAPSNSIRVTSDGKIGLGTAMPAYAAELQRSGMNSAFVVERTDGATNYINATASFGNFGTVSNHPLRLAVNGTWQMRLNNDSSITMTNGASLTAGGVWTNASSRALKKDIEDLSVEEATAALSGMEPVKFAYKSNGERHVGFIAEDVPDLVASVDRNGLSPMDVVAVLTRIVQEQQEINNELRARITALESR